MSIPHTDKFGFFDYNNNGLAQSHNGSEGFIKLLNNGLGAYTNTTHKPTSMTSTWNATNNQFDFSELSLGDMVDIRFDVDVTTATSNQDIVLQLMVAVGGNSYPLRLVQSQPKSAGTYKLQPYMGIYIGDDNTRSNPAEVQIDTDTAITSGIVVNGWYVKVTRR